ncbi:hypothetical protein UY3_10812 [Chelonia mydas]|uniref:Uncharacterized protein n=1 Tax=Chelonia mydas TaxID=8469 RepID=M7B2F3_CHEMY|nr:hypothetical protein UY3_10812 [Chelonia mydas]
MCLSRPESAIFLLAVSIRPMPLGIWHKDTNICENKDEGFHQEWTQDTAGLQVQYRQSEIAPVITEAGFRWAGAQLLDKYREPCGREATAMGTTAQLPVEGAVARRWPVKIPLLMMMIGFRVTAVLVCIRKKKRSTCGTLETNQFIIGCILWMTMMFFLPVTCAMETVIGLSAFSLAVLGPAGWFLFHLPSYKKK